MSFFDSFKISASGMTAQRLRMDTISQNLANINTTRTDSGEAYRRKTVVFEEINDGKSFRSHLDSSLGDYRSTSLGSQSTGLSSKSNLNAGGVKVTEIVEDQSPFIEVYDPSHPDANEEGYVEMPNVNSVEEMTNLISANRSYEANITAFNATKAMASKALEIGS
jgi:flagellar basal-body rod protein FlgC